MIAGLLFRGNQYSDKIKKIALLTLYRIVNTMIYQQPAGDKHTHSDGIGLLVSPTKFKSFEPQVTEAIEQYRNMLEKPDPASPDPSAHARKDGARQLLRLIFENYLPMKENVGLWQNEPETFIEMESESYFISEFDLDSGCATNLIAYQVLEKIIASFYATCYEFLSTDLIPSYFNGQLQLANEFS